MSTVRIWLAPMAISAIVHGAVLLWPIVHDRDSEPEPKVLVWIETQAPPAKPTPPAPVQSDPKVETQQTAARRPSRGRAAPARKGPRLPAPATTGDPDGDWELAIDESDGEAHETAALAGISTSGGPAMSALGELPGGGVPGPPPARWDRNGYADRVRHRLEGEKRYPPRARRRGEQGEVMLKLFIGPSGRLARAPRIARTSGVAALDREAVRMARVAAPFPPTGVTGTLTIEVPVRFSLSTYRGG